MATLLELAKIKHHAVRSDGAKFLDGVRNDSLNTSWLTVNSSGRVTLGPGLYDELLVVKGEVSDEQIITWASMGAPFYDPSPVIPDVQIPSADKWDQKARTFYQDTPPIATGVGDIWIDTSDYNHMYRWNGTAWRDVNDNSPIDAGYRPVSAGGGRVLIDAKGAFGYDIYGVKRAGFGTDGRWIAGAGAVTADELGLMIKDLVTQELRLHLGNIGGQPWGDGVLAPGTYGLWGDQAGLYLRGYARLIDVGTAFDEDVIQVSSFPNLAEPEVLVVPKEMLSYSAQATGLSHLYVDTIKQPNGDYVVKSKTIIKGREEPWGGRSETTSSWSFIRPATATDGKKGVETDFFICRPTWRIVDLGVAGDTAKLWMDITDQFDSSGNPINWRTIKTFGRGMLGKGTLNWDSALPHFGTWALRVRGDGMKILFSDVAFTGLSQSGYRAGDEYLNSAGNTIGGSNGANEPSGMSVVYFVFDKG